MNYWAVDVETANPAMRSICQIGLVRFSDGNEVESYKFLIDPCEYFDPFNTSIHGISEIDVAGMPTLSGVWSEISSIMQGQFLVCHTHFYRTALYQAAQANGLAAFDCVWLDSAKVARRAWPSLQVKGYGFKKLADHFGIEFAHHDALEDARAAGLIFAQAIKDSGLDPSGWVERCKKAIDPAAKAHVSRSGHDDAPLSGQVLVFTGALTLPRRDAADLVAAAGARVTTSVSKNTTMLVIGDQDISRLAGADKSAKHRDAESLVAQGVAIKFLAENDFLALIESVNIEV